MPESVGSPMLWGVFGVLITVMLALDLGVLNRKPHVIKPREAAIWSVVWIGLALLFNLWIYFRIGQTHALEFLTGYLIEKALSVDNIFVFLVIFSYFSVPAEMQHRVLFWGVFGAIVLRAVFILAGSALLTQFHWVIYLFGAFLIFTGVKIMTQKHEEVHPENNPLLRLFTRIVPTVKDYHGHHFWKMIDGRLHATPLLLVLIAVEATDVMFAVDSIPAIFAVTRDPFIVFTSNIFAILGLRSLFFLVSGMVEKFHYLKIGLGLVLSFVGVKMLVTYWGFKVPIWASLLTITVLLGGSIIASLIRARRLERLEPPLPEHQHGADEDVPPFDNKPRPGLSAGKPRKRGEV